MMSYMVDVDILNYILKKRSPAFARFRAAVRGGASFFLSPVVHYEITRYFKLTNRQRLLRAYERLIVTWEPIVVGAEDWDLAADLWAERHRQGKPIQDADLLIAVTALKAGAVLVTNNTRHFEGLGLVIENWTAS